MAARMIGLEPRTIERLRAELAEALAATVAYPPFFDFRANRISSRPIDRARMEEIQRFLGSVNFSAIERADPSAPDTRRFIERLIMRYVEVNEALRGRFAARYVPRLRASAPRLASEVQRRMVAYLNGGVPDFGMRRQSFSWSSVTRHEARRSPQERERATRVLESALLQRSGMSSVSESAPARQTPSADATIPVPATAFTDSAPGGSPFAAFGDDLPPQRGPSLGLSEQPTGPMLAQPANPAAGRSALREAPPDLVALYGDYLNDMAPEAPPPPPSRAPGPPPAPRPAPSRHDAPPPSAQANGSPSANPSARNDLLIFWQLRYQLEAYIRRAARSYGLRQQGGDPATVLDTLRRSGYVDEADLRIAEGIFALTDRVTGQGHASEQEYRQALMLYLLYHRSHLNL